MSVLDLYEKREQGQDLTDKEKKLLSSLEEVQSASIVYHKKTRRSSTEHGLVFDAVCSQCTYATVFRRKDKMDIVVMCGAIGNEVVPSDIESCNRQSKPVSNVQETVLGMFELVAKNNLFVDPESHSERHDPNRGYL